MKIPITAAGLALAAAVTLAGCAPDSAPETGDASAGPTAAAASPVLDTATTAPSIGSAIGPDGACHVVIRTNDGQLWLAPGATEWGGGGAGEMLRAAGAWEHISTSGCAGAAPNDIDTDRPANQHASRGYGSGGGN